MKKTDTHVYFFTGKDIFSNFYSMSFIHQGIKFRTAEHAIMYRKAMLFGANHIAQQILKSEHPIQAKNLGRSKEIPFDNEIWEQHRLQIFKEVLLDKFSLPKLKKFILDIGDRKFVEASPYDRIWGCGLSADDPKILKEENWKGQNLLGQVLNDVQQQLINFEEGILNEKRICNK